MQNSTGPVQQWRSRAVAVALWLAVAIVCMELPYSLFAGQKGSVMSMHASGTFDVKVTPATDDKSMDPALGRLSLDKQYHGDLEGTGKGQMLTGSTDIKDSAAYVAIEKVTGTLKGRSGSFLMQHSGTLNRGAQQLAITVVPDSGTGQLAGLTGNFLIKIAEGKHSYEFDYTLPETK
jgi:Protein of unknown function (DUF3224)